MNNIQESAEAKCFVSIAHQLFDEPSIDFMAALSAVMTCDRYSAANLPEKDRAAGLAWFRSKYMEGVK